MTNWINFTKSLALVLLAIPCKTTANTKKPNVILIMTDDQGYGDIAAEGNKFIKTPNMDKLHDQSVRLSNYHVSPTSAPTRSALMTGKHSNRAGVWHTVNGRSILLENQNTIATIFKKNGYATGMFGKWHLGDNYPSRPQDNGFDEVLTHHGGGVGQSPDFFDNDYFDDTYLHNGVLTKYKGYCTDVWFENAIDFIESNQKKPFFCYLSPNAPHSPYFVADKYAEPYRNNPEIFNANFYGMITNIDENIGKLTAYLISIKLMDNTILIFTTDNGSAAGAKTEGHKLDGFISKGYNAGMRGIKASMYEGGHRVPFYLYWKDGGIFTGKDVNTLTAHYDILPTLIDLCGLKTDSNMIFDGTSLVPLIKTNTNKFVNRIVITNSQRNEFPEKWKRSATMQGKWRLINGQELYNLDSDPEQRTDVSIQFSDKREELKQAYSKWWEEIKQSYQKLPRITIGSSQENSTVLCSHDWHSPDISPWNQGMIRSGYIDNGLWLLNIKVAGKYKFQLRRWPVEAGAALNAALAARPMLEGTTVSASEKGKALEIVKAEMTIQNSVLESEVRGDELYIEFIADLEDGEVNLQTFFTLKDGKKLGAYYVYIDKL